MSDPDLLDEATEAQSITLPDDLVAKLRPYDDLIWFGHLFPREINLLLEAGCKATPKSATLLRRVPDLVDKEVQHEWWFYFIPPAELGLKSPWLY